jgi:hypothetical protein
MQRVCNMADGLGDKCIQIPDKLENAARFICPEFRLAYLSQLAGSATRETAPGLHRGQKVCTTNAILWS